MYTGMSGKVEKKTKNIRRFFFFGGNQIVPKLTVVMVVQFCRYTWNQQLYTSGNELYLKEASIEEDGKSSLLKIVHSS